MRNHTRTVNYFLNDDVNITTAHIAVIGHWHRSVNIINIIIFRLGYTYLFYIIKNRIIEIYFIV